MGQNVLQKIANTSESTYQEPPNGRWVAGAVAVLLEVGVAGVRRPLRAARIPHREKDVAHMPVVPAPCVQHRKRCVEGRRVFNAFIESAMFSMFFFLESEVFCRASASEQCCFQVTF